LGLNIVRALSASTFEERPHFLPLLLRALSASTFEERALSASSNVEALAASPFEAGPQLSASTFEERPPPQKEKQQVSPSTHCTRGSFCLYV